jgi:DNA-binding transcriptional LysR family regulator
MQLLEEELGVQLLIRGKRKITLTPEGHFLKERAAQMIALADKTVQQISGLDSKVSGKIYIGSIESLSVGNMPEWIVEFHKKYPDVNFNWWSGNSNDVLERLEHGLLDFAIVRTPCNNEKFISHALYKEPWTVFVNNDTAGDLITQADSNKAYDCKSDLRKISLSCLKDIPLIIPSIRTRAQEIKDWFGKINLSPYICCEISPAMNAISLVEAGMGAAILPKSAAKAALGRNITVMEITDPPMQSEIIIVYNKDTRLSAAAWKLINFIEEQCGTTCENITDNNKA